MRKNRIARRGRLPKGAILCASIFLFFGLRNSAARPQADHPVCSAGGGNGGAVTHSLWGGRFAAAPSALLKVLNDSFAFDRELFADDVEGSVAWARSPARSRPGRPRRARPSHRRRTATPSPSGVTVENQGCRVSSRFKSSI